MGKLEDALMLQERGLCLLPLEPRRKEPNRCLLPELDGRKSWAAYRKRQPSRSEIRGWLLEQPETNLGVITGAASGNLVVIDFDGRVPAGLHLPPTVTVTTNRGVHYYYRSSVPLRGFQFEVAGCKGDLKGEGGYVACPPSAHPSGDLYRWADCLSVAEVDIAPLPDDLFAQLEDAGNTGRTRESQLAVLTNSASVSLPWEEDGVDGSLEEACTSTYRDLMGGCSEINTYLTTVTGNLSLDGAFSPGRSSLAVSVGNQIVASTARDLNVVRRVLSSVGISAQTVGKAMVCPIPGHDRDDGGNAIGNGPSAALYEMADGALSVRCFHRDFSYLPVDLYYMALTGWRNPPKNSVRGIWWLRALAGAGVIDPVPITHRDLPADASDCARKLYAGFILLLGLREVWLEGQVGAPYAWDFAREWCGIGSNSTIKKGLGWLFSNGYLRVVGNTGGARPIQLLDLVP